MNFIPYLQRIAACRGGDLSYGILLGRSIVWCVDSEQARLIESLWRAWTESDLASESR